MDGLSPSEYCGALGFKDRSLEREYLKWQARTSESRLLLSYVFCLVLSIFPDLVYMLVNLDFFQEAGYADDFFVKNFTTILCNIFVFAVGFGSTFTVFRSKAFAKKSCACVPFVIAEFVFIAYTCIESFRFAYSINNFDNVFGVAAWAIFLAFGILVSVLRNDRFPSNRRQSDALRTLHLSHPSLTTAATKTKRCPTRCSSSCIFPLSSPWRFSCSRSLCSWWSFRW